MALNPTTTYSYTDVNQNSIFIQGNQLADYGTWSTGTTYSVLNVVQVGENSYIAIQTNIDVVPIGTGGDEDWSSLVIVEESGTIVPTPQAEQTVFVVGSFFTGSDAYARATAASAYALAQIGTNTGTAAYVLAQQAYTLAQTGGTIPYLAQLPDVSIPGPSVSDTLTYNGTVWIAAVPVDATARSIAQSGYAIAQIGTNTGSTAYSTAQSAYGIAQIGTNVGSTAYSVAQSAFSIALSGSNTANGAFAIAVSGTNQATAAYVLAQIGTNDGSTAYSVAQSAWALAQIGTNTGTAGYDRANQAYALAQIGTNTGSTAYSVAQSAWALAQIGTNVGSTAYSVAQSAYSVAQSGSNTANISFTISVIGTNTGSAAYSVAQTAYGIAQIGTNTGSSAYSVAQTAYGIAQIGTNTGSTAYSVAQSAWSVAQIGTNTGSTAYSVAQSAWALAQIGTNTGSTAYSVAQSAFSIAVTGSTTANAAYALAQSGTSASAALFVAQNAYALAQIGTNTGSAAYNTAQSAYGIAQIGTNTGSTAYSVAQTAYFIAQVGTNTGSTAYNTAQSAWALAQIGTNTGSTAYSVAQSAYTIAVAGTNLATSATNTGSAAYSVAQTAFSIAQIGTNTGSTAYSVAQTAYGIAQIGTNTGSTAYSVAQTAYGIAQIGTNTGSTAYNTAQTAYTIAQYGTNTGSTAYSVAQAAYAIAVLGTTRADAAYVLAQIGTNTGSAAYSVAQTAFSIAQVGTNTGSTAYSVAQTAYGIAQIGTNTGSTAYSVAQTAYGIAQIGTNTGSTAYSVAQTAYSIAQIGTNTGSTAYSVAQFAYTLAQYGTNTGTAAYTLATAGSNLAQTQYTEEIKTVTGSVTDTLDGATYTRFVHTLTSSATVTMDMTGGRPGTWYVIILKASSLNPVTLVWAAKFNWSQSRVATTYLEGGGGGIFFAYCVSATELYIGADTQNITTLGAQTINGSLTATQFVESSPAVNAVTATTGATTIDLSTSNRIALTLNASTTLTLNSCRKGITYWFEILQNATGGWIVNWPSLVGWGPYGAVVINSVASSRTFVAFYCIETSGTPQLVGWPTDGIYAAATAVTATTGATTLDLLVSNRITLTLQASTTLSITNVKVGQTYWIEIVQDGTGGWIVVWPAAVAWNGYSATLIQPAAAARTTIRLYCPSAGVLVGSPVGITGTAGRLARFSATPPFVTSSYLQDDGSQLGIGVTPSATYGLNCVRNVMFDPSPSISVYGVDNISTSTLANALLFRFGAVLGLTNGFTCVQSTTSGPLLYTFYDGYVGIGIAASTRHLTLRGFYQATYVAPTTLYAFDMMADAVVNSSLLFRCGVNGFTEGVTIKLDSTGSLITELLPLVGHKISGNTDPTNYYIGQTTISSNGVLDIHWYGGVRLIDSSGAGLLLAGGKVGIGGSVSVAPTNKLVITGASAAAAGTPISRFTTGTGLSTDEAIEIGIHDGDYSWIQAVKQGTAYRALALNPTGGSVAVGTTAGDASLSDVSITLNGNTLPAFIVQNTGVGKAFLTATSTQAILGTLGLTTTLQFNTAGLARVLINAGGQAAFTPSLSATTYGFDVLVPTSKSGLIARLGILGLTNGITITQDSGTLAAISIDPGAGGATTIPTGNLTVAGRVSALNYVATSATHAFSATPVWDLDIAGEETITLTGSISSMTTSNRGNGKKKILWLFSDGTAHTIAVNASWIPIGTAIDASLAASKTGVLSLHCKGSAETNVYYSYKAQP